MANLVPILSSVLAAIATLASGYLVYRASSENSQITSRSQAFEQQQELEDSLRSDIKELDTQRRVYYEQNVALLKTIERYRAWAYGLVRLLTDNGITDVPPEPDEITP